MSMVVAGMLGSVGTSIIGGLIGGGQAKKRERAAAAEKARLGAELISLENSRQAIINPYETTKDMSSIAKDLSGMLSNPYANLGVATNATKFEAEQIDISLANTLDTLMETGASAGGATALATAALKAKQGISANLESQEANNEKLKAQGEAQLQEAKMQEKERIQNVQLSEAQRVQAAEAAGKSFMFSARENREQQKIDRVAGQLQGAQARQMQAQADRTGALTGMISGISGALGNFVTAKAGMPPTASDRRLKENIINVGKSEKGFNIYNFEYKDKKFGEGVYQGVMSDEVPKEAVITGTDGFDRVNYSLLDVEFKKIK
jgi:hypothetical protein